MLTIPKIAIMGFSDGDPQVHGTLKQVVQDQVDAVDRADCSGLFIIHYNQM